MEYNTSKSKLIIPEYGRNIQELIEHAKKIEDTAYRQAFVEKIVDLMQQMHPQSRNVEDYVAKLWSHVFIIAGYELDVKPPVEVPSRDDIYKRPERIPYPSNQVRYRHYGKNIQEMIKKAIKMEEEDKKVAFTQVIGAYMKLAYKTWNQDSVSDDIIRKNLENLSKGELTLSENLDINNLINPRKTTKRNISHTNSNSQAKNGKNSKNRRKDTKKGKNNKRRK